MSSAVAATVAPMRATVSQLVVTSSCRTGEGDAGSPQVIAVAHAAEVGGGDAT